MNEVKEIRKLISQVLTDLVDNPDITFKQLYELTDTHLSITYMLTNLEGEECTVYADHVTEPDSLVREAVVKSSTIPFFYEAYMEGKGISRLVSCDGGVTNNFPMNIPKELGYEPNEIIGLKLIAGNKINLIEDGGPGVQPVIGRAPTNVFNYITTIVNKLRDQALRIHVDKYDWMLSVKINVGSLTSTDFNLTKEQSDWLYEQGKNAALEYVEDLTGLLEKGEYPYAKIDNEL